MIKIRSSLFQSLSNHLEYIQQTDEFSLFRYLAKEGFDEYQSRHCNSSSMALFDSHYQLMHHLHHLRLEWLDKAYKRIEISLTQIIIHPYSNAQEGITLPDSMALFYLDYTNRQTIDESALATMLQNFWQAYSSTLTTQQRTDALSVLGLNPDATWPQIKKQFHVLAHQHHPDKGGSPKNFAEIRNAFEQLKKA